jgi:vitamin B12 transporter
MNVFSQDSTSSTKNYTLEEITVSSTKLDTKLIDVPTRIDIIDSKKITAANGSRLPDILKTQSNIFIKSYGITPALSTISTNGLGAEHTLILVDGVKLNSFQNSHIDLSFIPKEYIEKIEIINNGVSSIYGSDAIGGVINIILKNRELLEGNKTSKFGASVSQGSFNTFGYSFNVYKEIEKFNIGANFNKESSDGKYEYYFNNEIRERQNAAYDLYDIGLRAQYLIDNENVVKLLSTYSDQDKEVPGIETGTTPAPTNQLDRNWNNIISIDNKLNDDLFLKTNFNFQNNFQDYSVGTFLNSEYKNLVYSGGSELRYKKENYGLTSGYSFTHATLESDELKAGIKRNQHALFLSSFYNAAKYLKFYPSARYDHMSDISEGTLTYKLGINLQPLGNSTFGIRGNIGKNFRAPSFNDLYWKNTGNENLKPERSINFESGIFFNFTEIINGKIELTHTYISAENKIVWIPQANGLWAPQNIAESISNNISLNLNLAKRISENLSFKFDSGLQLTNTKKTSASYENDPTKNKYIPYIPLQAVNINIGTKYRFLGVNIFYSHSGKRYSDFENKNKMESYNTLNGNITTAFDIWEVAGELRLEVNNITNTEYEVISGYPMPLRFYKVAFSINY